MVSLLKTNKNSQQNRTEMGIHGLTKLLGDNAPNSMKEDEIKNYFGKDFKKTFFKHKNLNSTVKNFLIQMQQQRNHI